MPAPAATQQAIERALGAAAKAGLTVTGFSVARDGTISVTTTASAAGKTPAPRLVDMQTGVVQRLEPKQWNR